MKSNLLKVLAALAVVLSTTAIPSMGYAEGDGGGDGGDNFTVDGGDGSGISPAAQDTNDMANLLLWYAENQAKEAGGVNGEAGAAASAAQQAYNNAQQMQYSFDFSNLSPGSGGGIGTTTSQVFAY